MKSGNTTPFSLRLYFDILGLSPLSFNYYYFIRSLERVKAKGPKENYFFKFRTGATQVDLWPKTKMGPHIGLDGQKLDLGPTLFPSLHYYVYFSCLYLSLILGLKNLNPRKTLISFR